MRARVKLPIIGARRIASIGGLAALVAVLGVTALAYAYWDAVNGQRHPVQTLYVGNGYHELARVSAIVLNFTPSSMCAKGLKPDGTHKNGGGCTSNVAYRNSFFDAPSLVSAGYGYYTGGSQTARTVAVAECGVADASHCNYP